MLLTKQSPNKLDFWAKDRDNGYWWHICEGTGDNLLSEDVDEGYVDYIYYDYYESLSDIREDNVHDGGMILLKRYYQDMRIDEIIREVQDFEDTTLDVVE